MILLGSIHGGSSKTSMFSDYSEAGAVKTRPSIISLAADRAPQMVSPIVGGLGPCTATFKENKKGCVLYTRVL